MKSQLFERQLTFNLTGYVYDYQDLQVAVFDTTLHAFRTQNAAKARIRGLELETSFRPKAIPGLNLHASAALNEAKFEDYLADCYAGQSISLGCNQVLNTVTGRYTSQSLKGAQLRKAPRFAATFGGYYEQPLSDGIWASISADGNYSSSYNTSTNYNPYANQPAFTKIDATFRLFTADKRWELAVIGRNLSDVRNLINANDRNNTGGAKGGTTTCQTLTQTGCDLLPDITGTPALPRTVAVQVTFKY
jgi:outer membrane receptor protein involved in Fe transport